MLYADGYLDAGSASIVELHLAECPLCRQEHFEIREIRNRLRQMSRPEIPVGLANTVKRVVNNEIRLGRPVKYRFYNGFGDWIRMQVMPYGVGVFASVAIAFAFVSVLFSSINTPVRYGSSTQTGPGVSTSSMLATSSDPLSASDYASQRLDVANESPSINPKGALIALTKSLVRGDMKDDEVVVVADVFGNGLARISDVVEPSRDRNAVVELERALETDPAYAPFVPAVMDQRSNNVRVVLRFQSVDVSTGIRPRKR